MFAIRRHACPVLPTSETAINSHISICSAAKVYSLTGTPTCITQHAMQHTPATHLVKIMSKVLNIFLLQKIIIISIFWLK
jgi:hypothetical protein